VISLKRKSAKALQAMKTSLEVFKELDKCVHAKLREEWQQQEDLAMQFRGDYLSIYNVKSESGEFSPTSIQ